MSEGESQMLSMEKSQMSCIQQFGVDKFGFYYFK
ncbi:hypothetical protein CCACVL1_24439 [Corchorus capsularis]|uniref:Uncharacterized protein n=1 Tax=Corchorus capsularis TaxID=210143 RepID=A0A1R3GPQ8_COCAP|nr:hypothetical protein CCACVL1_24439 [Corchorus capsularis]